MSSAFAWSFGRNRYDVLPEQRSAASFRVFAREVLTHLSVDKATAPYICAPFGGDGHRSAKNAMPRAWLALDVDDIDPDTHADWRLHLTRWRGFGWPTASSTPKAPRERVIIALSVPVDRAQGIAIGALILRDVGENFGASVRIDPCGFRPEQPAFCAPFGVMPFFLLGDPLDVPEWLAQAPAAPPQPPPASAVVVAIADARLRWIVSTLGDAGLLRSPLANERGHAVICPWSRQHTGESAPSSTVVLFPSEENQWRGGFSCLHAHCTGRRLRDLVDILQRALRQVAA